jgi:two-component system, NarL family, invasion response regulator UvrY
MSVSVLIADDQMPFRRAARALLDATAGFRCVGEATSGEEAVALVESLRPDLVLMDIAMTGIGGIEATRSIAARHPDTTTVLVSTYREEDLPRDARVCGAVAYLHKSNLDGHALRQLWSERRYPLSER